MGRGYGSVMKTRTSLATAAMAATLLLAACAPGEQQPVGQPTPGTGGQDVPSSGIPGENVVPTQAGQPGETFPPSSPAMPAPTL